MVDFANILLAKHEANMKQREKEGIGYSLTNNHTDSNFYNRNPTFSEP